MPERLQRLLREPLLHFMAIAAVLFAVNAVVNPSILRPSGNEIIVTEGRVRQLAESFQLVSGRIPDARELEALVDDFVIEEAAYREALAMGLDVDDTVVRRRLRQKLEFLLEDVSAVDEPTDSELTEFMATHPDRYATPQRLSLQQVLASADKRGDAASSDAATMLARLRAGTAPEKLGDESLLPAAVPLTSREGLASIYGDAFAEAVFSTSEDNWFGPVASPFGYHLVQITGRSEPKTPSLEMVGERVRADWIDVRRQSIREEQRQRLLGRYDIRVEWPAGSQPKPPPADGPAQ